MHWPPRIQLVSVFSSVLYDIEYDMFLYYTIVYTFLPLAPCRRIIKNLSLAAPSPANLPKNLSLGKGIRSS